MTARRKEPSAAELVEALARAYRVTLKPAGGRTFEVDLPDMQLSVEITMKVHHKASRDEVAHYRETALDRIADPDRGQWEDGCDTSVKERGHFHLPRATSSCKKPVIGVVVTKHYDLVYYSFRCHVHMDRPTRDDTKIVHRETMRPALEVARDKRAKAIALRAKLAKMTPAELVEHDASELARQGCSAAKEALPRIRSEIAAAKQIDPTGPWLDRGQIAEILGCTVDTVIAMESRGLLRSSKLDPVRMVDLFEPAHVVGLVKRAADDASNRRAG